MRMMSCSVGEKHYVAITGRKDSFTDKTEVDYIAKTLMSNVLDETFEELKTNCEDQRNDLRKNSRSNYVRIVMKTLQQ